MTDELSLLRNEVATLENELMSLRQFIRSLQNVTDAVDADLSAENVMALLEQILQNAMNAVWAANGSLLVLDEDTNELVFVVTAGGVNVNALADVRLPVGTGIAGWVAANREPTIVEDTRTDSRFYNDVDNHLHFETKSVLATPIIGGGKLLGVVEILNKEPGKVFTADDLNLVSLLCRYAGELLYSVEVNTSSSEKEG